MNGYDKYLEYLFDRTDNFYNALFRAIALADHGNLSRLSNAFPEEVHAYRLWTLHGRDALAPKCTPGHPLIARLQPEGVKPQ